MELDEFLEKDILRFLEERKKKKVGVNIDREEDYGLYLTKDYLKEVTSALEKDEISMAQKLFDELKTHYDSLPKGSLEEKKIYSLLEQIYSKINSYVQLRGDSRGIKSFNDMLGQGFRGSLSSKIHLTTTKMDKKLDNIDVKLTGFGRDMKDLKTTLSVPNLHATSKMHDLKMHEELKKISDETILLNNNIEPNIHLESIIRTGGKILSENRPVILKSPKIEIIAPDSPKDSKRAPIIDREKRILTVPKEIEKKEVEDITVFEEHKTMPPKEVKPSQLMRIQAQNIDQHDKQIPQSPHTTREEPQKRMKLFKIPKKGHKKEKAHDSTFMTKEKDKGGQDKGEKDKEKIFLTKEIGIVKKAEKSVFEKTKEEQILPDIILIDKKKSIEIKEEKKESFDSPFQEPAPENKIAENTIVSSDVQKTKKSLSRSLTNSYEEIYSAALKELNLKNYEGASKLFMKVLALKPTHKASIIRLKQCEEAMHNA